MQVLHRLHAHFTVPALSSDLSTCLTRKFPMSRLNEVSGGCHPTPTRQGCHNLLTKWMETRTKLRGEGVPLTCVTYCSGISLHSVTYFQLNVPAI